MVQKKTNLGRVWGVIAIIIIIIDTDLSHLDKRQCLLVESNNCL